MAISITHAFTSAKSDGADNTVVQPSDWNAAHTVSVTGSWNPESHDGAALGTAALGWSDLFLATGGVITWGEISTPDVQITHSADTLTFTGAATNYSFDGLVTGARFVPSGSTIPTNGMYLPAANTLGWGINSAAELALTATALYPASNDGLALGISSTNMWSDLFLADDGVVNWGAGGVTETHTAASDSLTFSADSGNALGSTQINFDVDGARTCSINATGIAFNADTAAANSLDDYEEGTWQPAFAATGWTSITYDYQIGYYTKIGRHVHCFFYIAISAGTNAAGNVEVTGLPVSCVAQDGFTGTVAVSDIPTTSAPFACFQSYGGSSFYLFQPGVLGRIDSNADISGGPKHLIGHISYPAV